MNVVRGSGVIGVGSLWAANGMAQTTERVSVDSSGIQGNGDTDDPSISADGRYVAFASFASNLVPGDTNGASTSSSTTARRARPSASASTRPGAGERRAPEALDLRRRPLRGVRRATPPTSSPGTRTASSDVFVHDRQTGTTERVSVDSAGNQGNDDSCDPVDLRRRPLRGVRERRHQPRPGRHERRLRRLRPRPPDRRDRARQRRLGRGPGQRQRREYPSISADGRFVAFDSLASNLVPGDTNGMRDVFVHDRQTGTTERVSVDSAGTQGNERLLRSCSISADGRFVAFDERRQQPRPGRHERRHRRLRPRPPDGRDRARQRRLGRDAGQRRLLRSRRSPPTAASWRSKHRHQPRPGRHERLGTTSSSTTARRARPSASASTRPATQGNNELRRSLDLRRRPLRGVRELRQQPRPGRHERRSGRLRPRPGHRASRSTAPQGPRPAAVRRRSRPRARRARAPRAASSSTPAAVEGDKDGLFFFGTQRPPGEPGATGRATSAWSRRSCAAACSSGAAPPALATALLAGLERALVPDLPQARKEPRPGAPVQAQLWYRDPLNTSNQTTSLSDAIEFPVCP